MAVNTSRLLASRKVSEAGIRTFCGRSRPGGGRSRVRSMSVWSSVLPSRETATRARSLLRVERSSSSMTLLVGVQLGRDAVFDERLVELADGRQTAGALQVIFGGAHLRPFEPDARVAVVGLERAAPWCIRRPRGRSPGGIRRRGQMRAPWTPRSRQRDSQRRPERRGALNLARGISNDINSPRNIEREFLIGQSGVFLQICKDERRFAALGVHRQEALDGERRRIDA